MFEDLSVLDSAYFFGSLRRRFVEAWEKSINLHEILFYLNQFAFIFRKKKLELYGQTKIKYHRSNISLLNRAFKGEKNV